ncbi:MAG: DUF2058 domain-containing protein [Halomonadaceae bacterium]|nr:MAG: DUF2058 domain-containing protein [Halomonadaceae bacterium]
MPSLQDQLLKAGLADENKAKQVRKAKRDQQKQLKQKPKGSRQVNESRDQARQAQQESAERDRKLNQEREAAAQRKAVAAQIRQLVQSNKIDLKRGDTAYQFVHGSKIKKIHVPDELVDQLSRGRLAVVCLGEAYEVVPEVVARKIQQRDPDAIVVLHDRHKDDLEEDDPYAGYEIPDDLMW